MLSFGISVRGNFGFDFNDHGFLFPYEALELGETISGIKVFDPFEEIILSEQDFNLFVSIFLQKVILNAEKSNSIHIKADWWILFKENVNFISEKLHNW
jgi:hypothetical protein